MPPPPPPPHTHTLFYKVKKVSFLKVSFSQKHWPFWSEKSSPFCQKMYPLFQQ